MSAILKALTVLLNASYRVENAERADIWREMVVEARQEYDHLRDELERLAPLRRKLKSEWWELWWVKPGMKPVFISMYGDLIPPWIPDGCHPSKESAFAEKKRQKNKYIKVIHVCRYAKVNP